MSMPQASAMGQRQEPLDGYGASMISNRSGQPPMAPLRLTVSAGMMGRNRFGGFGVVLSQGVWPRLLGGGLSLVLGHNETHWERRSRAAFQHQERKAIRGPEEQRNVERAG